MCDGGNDRRWWWWWLLLLLLLLLLVLLLLLLLGGGHACQAILQDGVAIAFSFSSLPLGCLFPLMSLAG